MDLNKIAVEINEMVKVDQDIRAYFYSMSQTSEEQYNETVLPIDLRHTDRMKTIISQIGYPTISKVVKKPRLMPGLLFNTLLTKHLWNTVLNS